MAAAIDKQNVGPLQHKAELQRDEMKCATEVRPGLVKCPECEAIQQAIIPKFFQRVLRGMVHQCKECKVLFTYSPFGRKSGKLKEE